METVAPPPEPPEEVVVTPDIPGVPAESGTQRARKRARGRPRLDGSGPFRSPSPLSDGADIEDRLHGVPMEGFRARRLRANVIRDSSEDEEVAGGQIRGLGSGSRYPRHCLLPSSAES
ncbi:histone-lysine N-methyltransferase 2C-like [Solenopsis invicta]|uniref:histone-lysine N-methyltransferase 2C-like n=1 Tax=Solenopsis invicta TaxID=13686 RepID=UPI00193E3328|nr:histone-lysine N-methyltransferase 2C-like [Solenopsis invicta]